MREGTCILQWCAGGMLRQKSLQPWYQVHTRLLSPLRCPHRSLHLSHYLYTGSTGLWIGYIRSHWDLDMGCQQRIR